MRIKGLCADVFAPEMQERLRGRLFLCDCVWSLLSPMPVGKRKHTYCHLISRCSSLLWISFPVVMAAEPVSRFAHFLQPIRDLSKIWKIDIAEELEKYIEEVTHLVVSDPENGHTQLNFAEAALLIQGSTAIYSRKVELLYQLVYQALDLLSSTKATRDPRKGKTITTGLWGPIPETDELLTIDHLIKEGKNIQLDPNHCEQRQGMQRRVPLFLMPRDKNDRRKQEFRISSCTVHASGAYLLQESDAVLLDQLLETNGSMQQRPDEPLAPALSQ